MLSLGFPRGVLGVRGFDPSSWPGVSLKRGRGRRATLYGSGLGAGMEFGKLGAGDQAAAREVRTYLVCCCCGECLYQSPPSKPNQKMENEKFMNFAFFL